MTDMTTFFFDVWGCDLLPLCKYGAKVAASPIYGLVSSSCFSFVSMSAFVNVAQDLAVFECSVSPCLRVSSSFLTSFSTQVFFFCNERFERGESHNQLLNKCCTNWLSVVLRAWVRTCL